MAVEVDQRVRIAAAPERVWRALVEHDDLRRWLFPSAVADVRARAARGASRFRTGRRRAACTTRRSTSAGPIVELDPGRVLAVAFEPPYWGVLRFELSPDGDGTELRVTQRGFEGNEDWLADFRGGWGSFNDRLALLCEIGEVATARRLEAAPAAARTLEPGELAGALAQLRARPLPARPYWYADGGPHHARPPGRRGGRGLRAAPAKPPSTRSAWTLPPTADLEAARASLERSLPRRGWTAAGPLRAAVDPAHPGRLRAGAPLPPGARTPSDPEPFVRAFERAFCAPGRAAAGAYFAPHGALALAGGPHPRPLDTPLARLPAGAVARFWRLRLIARRRAHRRLGRQRLDGRPQPRHEHVDVRRRRPHRAARPALRPGRAAHGRRMTQAWVRTARRARRPRAHAAGRARRRRARRLARDRPPRGADLPRDERARRGRGAHRTRSTACPSSPRGGGTSLTGATVPTRGGLVIAFNRMQAILDLDVEERTALVQPGLPNAALDREARRHGLRYTPDPSSRAASVIGGNIGTNAGGLHCLGHGVTADHVLGLEVVFGDGTIAWLEDTDADRPARARDRQRGHARDRHLRAGAPAAAARAPGRRRCRLPAAGAVPAPAPSAWCSRRPGLVACEFIDEAMLRGARPHGAGRPADERRGGAADRGRGARRRASTARSRSSSQCVEEAGGSAREARSDEEIEIAWNARRSAFGALGRMHADSYTHDFATPRDRLVSSLRAAAEIAARHGLVLSSVAHLGDGNLHPRLHYDAREPGVVRARPGGRARSCS